ncbi:hypothetical protein DFH07DRAFT_778702 [Mycena maculata]|uniref:Uncharacterized protein n=1 Tax=Mycena maculata TaxID=230809 RepID=A0AAD7IBN6_9AGAR|nr:hypothetical protein DFH07DRAFT_778702 [Mycena maculata]
MRTVIDENTPRGSTGIDLPHRYWLHDECQWRLDGERRGGCENKGASSARPACANPVCNTYPPGYNMRSVDMKTHRAAGCARATRPVRATDHCYEIGYFDADTLFAQFVNIGQGRGREKGAREIYMIYLHSRDAPMRSLAQRAEGKKGEKKKDAPLTFLAGQSTTTHPHIFVNTTFKRATDSPIGRDCCPNPEAIGAKHEPGSGWWIGAAMIVVQSKER